MSKLRRKPAPVGNSSELLLRPIRNIDISAPGFEGMHQLRIFKDITPNVTPNSGVFVLFVNQQQKGTTPLQKHHAAWYTGRLEFDAIPVEFLDLDKVYYAIEEAKRLNEQLKKKEPDGER